MEQRGNEREQPQPEWHEPTPFYRPPSGIPVVFYNALVDVDLIHSQLRFNEQLDPDVILEALREMRDPLIISVWPPKGTTERNTFVLMSLIKIEVYASLTDVTALMLRTNAQPGQHPLLGGSAEELRDFAYQSFPGARQAREDGGGYRRCEFESCVHSNGVTSWSYRLFPDGTVPPGLGREEDFHTFVRYIARADLLRRINAEHGQGANGPD